MTILTKQCTTCNQDKPLTKFHSNKYGKYGKRSECAQCYSDKYNKPKMAKPIFVVKIPSEVSVDDTINIQDNLTKQLPDYHVLVVSCIVKDIQFQCFYDKDMTHAKAEDIKSSILAKIKRIKS